MLHFTRAGATRLRRARDKIMEQTPTFASTPDLVALGKLLKRTTSRCPACSSRCPAEVWQTMETPARVFLKRTCRSHGAISVCIASDARFYWLAKGNPHNSECECGPISCSSPDGRNRGTLGRNANPGEALGVQEKLATCLALIEIVNSCNLSCPTCYADSPSGANAPVNAVPVENLKARIQGVVDRKGSIEVLQLSGGEPTLHPEFFQLLRWIQEHPGIDYVLLNTNGIRIAQDPAFADELATAFHYGRFQLYLQFDGVQEAGQQFLRGRDLRKLRNRCIERCAAMHVPITLAMTVTRQNLSFLWDAIEFGLRWPHVRGISFQPMFSTGRVPQNITHRDRLNTADIILAAVAQSSGQIRFEDFTPLPCGDPNCATIGYLLKVGGQIRSISEFIDFGAIQTFLGDKIRYKLEELTRCGCESEPLGALLKQFELNESHTFRLFVKPFMDALTWDEDRIDRCCTHVIRPDGKLDSFCRYYSNFSGGGSREHNVNALENLSHERRT
jgi:7,8-dihydro-6-hydroxymethylpterin dimethyltransferase